MRHFIALSMFCMAGFVSAGNIATILPSKAIYGIGKWNADSLGNHRAKVEVTKTGKAVLATIPWRRRDFDPEKKNIIVTDSTGKRIPNVERISITREKGEIVFEPTAGMGTYYIYYMPYRCDMKSYPKTVYPEFKNTANADWAKALKAPSSLPATRLQGFEDIDTLNSFYPMEIIATASEMKAMSNKLKGKKMWVFPEDRAYPIRMTRDLPFRWVDQAGKNTFSGQADRGEYYAFQTGIYAPVDTLKNVRLTFGELKDEATGQIIPSTALTCFNTDGTDVTGKTFRKTVNVTAQRVKAFWAGIDIPENQVPGTYKGSIIITSDNAEQQEVALSLTVSPQLIAHRGDDEPWRHSRLRWLNSQKGEDDEVIAPYTPLKLDGNTISCLGRTVEIAPTGFPKQITSYFDDTMTELTVNGKPLLSHPIDLVAGGEWQNLSFRFTKQKSGAIAWTALNQNDHFLMQLEAQMEFDGNIAYKVNLISRFAQSSENICLWAGFAPGVVKYKTGLGVAGGLCPEQFTWKWDVQKNQDAVWLGDVNGGLQFRFYDDKYVRPLNTNFYHQQPLVMPDAWVNNGRGGINMKHIGEETVLTAFTGQRDLKQNEQLKLYFNVLVTPFHTMDTEKQWADRYYHAYVPIDTAAAAGATIINVHHGTPVNPFINYPFLRPTEMKAYIDEAHKRGIKVKIYDTVRELSNSCKEIFALRSLDGEIFSPGKGGGYAWLQEHFDQDYIGAWFVPEYRDAAIINTAVSRWHNYYIEGLDWLVRNVGIDGLYIDDLAFDRETMKRVRKTLMSVNPGTRIDLHSANQFNPTDGFASSANLYMEHLPYLDRLWFGEYFKYNSAPDYWLMEVSGIPFGLMGEMLQDGGNPWRGMVYGMTNRLPWSGDPRPLWKAMDNFGIKNSKMIGYWSKKCPVKTDNADILATAYVSKGRTLVSIGSWAKTDAPIHLSIDWKALGLSPKHSKIVAPAISKFQEAGTWKMNEAINIPAGKGLLLIVE